MSGFWSWLTGRPQFQTEVYGIDVNNKAIEDREAVISICLQAQIEDGKTLGWRVFPGVGEGNSPLAGIRDEITQPDQRIIIRSITRLSTHNDLSVDLCFELQHPFEHDVATDVVRKRRDDAIAADSKRGATSVQSRIAPSTVNNSNHHARGQGVRLEQPTDTEDFSALLSEADDRTVEREAGGSTATSAREKLDRVNRITLRGGQYQSNEAERENVINLGTVRARTTSVKPEIVYRASLSDDRQAAVFLLRVKVKCSSPLPQAASNGSRARTTWWRIRRVATT